MKRLTLDKTWIECLRMWKWVIEQWKKGRRDVEDLKDEWLKKHGYEKVEASCFFCDYFIRRKKHIYSKDYTKDNCCKLCPAVKVDSKFSCYDARFHYHNNPIAFYAKLVELNKKRKAKK